MDKRKYFYYIGILEKGGLSLVISIDNKNKVCCWDTNKKPLVLSKEDAIYYCKGLCMNFISAIVIQSFWELNDHFI